MGLDETTELERDDAKIKISRDIYRQNDLQFVN